MKSPHTTRKECDFIFGSPPGWIIIVQIHSLLCSRYILYLRHNNSTMQSKVTINMRRRLSVFVCNSSFSQTWHCRIASFRVQKGIGSIISQRHFDRARDSTLHRCCCWYYGVHIRKNGSNQNSAHRKRQQTLFKKYLLIESFKLDRYSLQILEEFFCHCLDSCQDHLGTNFTFIIYHVV